MSRHLVFFIHTNEAMRARYVDALSSIGEMDYVQVYLGPSSSSYSVEAQRLKDKDGRCLPMFLAKYGPNSNRKPASITLLHYSAGYGLVRELIRHDADVDMVDAVCGIDSLHTSLTSSGEPSKLLLTTFAGLAKRAKTRGDKLLVVGHTDVKTTGYASTTASAKALVEMVMGTGNNFIVREYNERKDDLEEHRWALQGWGSELVKELVAPFLAGRPREPEPHNPPWLDPTKTLGERAVLWSLNEMANGVRENPLGSNTGERIRFYLSRCIRRETGRLLGIQSGAWCAAAANCASYECLLPGEGCPAYRASGVEMIEDAQENGTFHSAEDVRAGKYVPKVGDIVALDRSHEGQAWMRHICRLEKLVASDGSFPTLGGNEGPGEWRRTARHLSDKDLIGFIEAGGQVGATS